MKICFSLVLFKHSISEIHPLLSSINLLQYKYPILDCSLFIYDGSKTSYTSSQISALRGIADQVPIQYFHGLNIGYGMGNNYNFKSISSPQHFLFVVVNPDIYFEPVSVFPLFEWCFGNPSYSCVAPLILNQFHEVQFSAKRNPTFLSLLIGRLSFLRFFHFFRMYDEWHKQLNHNYSSEMFESTYLSGCFLIIPSNCYRLVDGFSSSFFLHLEDADIVRRLSMIGRTIHNPLGVVNHLWARGSHKSLKQMLYLFQSYLAYIRLWGFSLF